MLKGCRNEASLQRAYKLQHVEPFNAPVEKNTSFNYYIFDAPTSFLSFFFFSFFFFSIVFFFSSMN